MRRIRQTLCVLMALNFAACGGELDETGEVDSTSVEQTEHTLTFSRASAEEEAPEAPLGVQAQVIEPIEAVPVVSGANGGYVSPAPAPWNREPVVYRQYVDGYTSNGYSSAWSRWRALGYHPASVNAYSRYGSPRYSGLWYRDDNVLDWASQRNMSAAEYDAEWSARRNEGYRVLDLDAHKRGSSTEFNAIWVREHIQPNWKSHRRLSPGGLTSRINSYRLQGYRPIRINGYKEGSQQYFTAVFVRDGETDFEVRTDLSAIGLIIQNNTMAQSNYVPVDFGVQHANGSSNRFVGIWMRGDSRIKDTESRLNLSAEQLEEANEDYTRKNLVLVDVDAYTVNGLQRFHAIWHRTEDLQLLSSNLPMAGDADANAIALTLAGFATPGPDNRAGKLGFFIQDLQTGDYISVNQHEPFYMASTTKVLIGAHVAAHPNIDWADFRWFGSTTWRGEGGANSRGFNLSDVNTLVTVQTFMTNMMQGSDTASTDRMHADLVQRDGTFGHDDWLRDVVGLQNVGEVTSICEVDKRISAGGDANSCVYDVSCDTFETWFRGTGGPYWNATQAEQDCLDNLPGRTVERHETYYTSLANTITPAEFGRFWKKLADGDLMANADRATYLQILDGGWDDVFNVQPGLAYQVFGTKNGGKRRVSTQVGIMWDWNGAVGDYTDITPRYAFALFTEDWDWETGADLDSNGTQDDTQWARTAMSQVLNRGISFLRNN